MIEKLSLIDQWNKFKTFVASNLQKDKEEGIFKFALSTPLFSILSQLLNVYLTIPLSTSSCERVFSKMNIIKTDLRNRMEPNTLQQLMMISDAVSRKRMSSQCVS